MTDTILKRYYYENDILCGNCNGDGIQGYMDYCRACEGKGIMTCNEYIFFSKGDKIIASINYKNALNQLNRNIFP
jgi:RecJ-like exonuclease